MAKPRRNKIIKPPKSVDVQRDTDSQLGTDFELAAAALFQVPKSAVDEAEAKRPKRKREST